jgi:MFS family permease
MSLLHAWFGAGATISPFISTLFVKHVPQAYRYYLVAAAVALIVAITLVLVFEGRTAEQIVKMDSEGDGEEEIPLNPNPSGEQVVVVGEREKKERQGSGDKMWSILKMPAVYAIVTYMFIYVSSFLNDWGRGKLTVIVDRS